MLIFPDKETELKFNDMAREQFISKMLKELTIDLTICKIAKPNEALKYWGEYIKRIKFEIDRLYERIRDNENI